MNLKFLIKLLFSLACDEAKSHNKFAMATVPETPRKSIRIAKEEFLDKVGHQHKDAVEQYEAAVKLNNQTEGSQSIARRTKQPTRKSFPVRTRLFNNGDDETAIATSNEISALRENLDDHIRTLDQGFQSCIKGLKFEIKELNARLNEVIKLTSDDEVQRIKEENKKLKSILLELTDQFENAMTLKPRSML
jgi:molecular chaperone GrpE (heat shock protein)